MKVSGKRLAWALALAMGIFFLTSDCMAEDKDPPRKTEAVKEAETSKVVDTSMDTEAPKHEEAAKEKEPAKDTEPAVGKLVKIAFVTTGKACKCTMKRCKLGGEALDAAMRKFPKAPAPEVLDYASDTDKEKVKALLKKHPVVALPALYFFGSEDALLDKLDGEFDEARVSGVLAKYLGSADGGNK